MSFNYLVGVLVIGNAVGALASFAAGMADRFGRANIVCYGLFVTGAITAFGLPNAGGKATYLVLFAVLSIVEGAVLVATPALIRDYSPQLGRASAMGFWTLGPVLGSLIVTEVATHTLATHTDWRYQFHVAGTIGLIVAVITFIGLRELAPTLRDQIMVSLRDRALIEAKAVGLDEEAAMKGHWRQMLVPGIILPAAGISVFLLAYYVLVAFFVVFAATVLGYSEARANALANWYWIANAISLVAVGLASDKLRVRKPFMVGGAAVSATALAIFATRTTHPTTGYYTFAVLLAISAAGGGVAYCAWMAAFTESIEKRNPAATATGLAVWGMIVRLTVTVGFLVLPHVVTASSPLVDKGPTVQSLAARYAGPLATLQKIDPATSAALTLNPADTAAQARAVSELAGNGISAADVAHALQLQASYPAELATAGAIDPATSAALHANAKDLPALVKAVGEIATTFHINQSQATIRLIAFNEHVPVADQNFLAAKGATITAAAATLTSANAAIPKTDLGYLQANAATVQKAQKDAPKQWEDWFLVAFAGQLVFLLTIPLLTGRWSPRQAAADAAAHEAAVAAEMAALPEAPIVLADVSEVGMPKPRTPAEERVRQHR
jgi:MFS family permease